MSQNFDYDQEIPLGARVVERIEEDGYLKEKITFRGIRDNRVPGYLAIPKNGTGPYPCVVQLHGLDGSKKDWWVDNNWISGGNITKKLLANGYAVLALDSEYHGERIANNNYEAPGIFIFQKGWQARGDNMIIQSVTEYRRALDYLATRSEIDTSRIGLVGVSMGGFMTFMLTGIDSRIKASVACVTPIKQDQNSVYAAFNYAPHIDQSFLMLMGKSDGVYTEKEAQQLHDLLGSNSKELYFYNSGHRLPSEWTEKALLWFQKYLN
jgi:cephalosporin-C deacetylase-like acetyl esterase